MSITALPAHGVRAASPPNTPGIARLRTRATQHAPSEPARRRLWTAVRITARPRARSARGPPPYQPANPPNTPGIARLCTRATQQAPSEPASRRLWTAVRITALGAHEVRAARPPNQPGHARLCTRASPHRTSHLRSHWPSLLPIHPIGPIRPIRPIPPSAGVFFSPFKRLPTLQTRPTSAARKPHSTTGASADSFPRSHSPFV